MVGGSGRLGKCQCGLSNRSVVGGAPIKSGWSVVVSQRGLIIVLKMPGKRRMALSGQSSGPSVAHGLWLKSKGISSRTRASSVDSGHLRDLWE